MRGYLTRTAIAAAVMMTAPQGAQAQIFLTQPDYRAGPIEGSDPLVGLAIPGATAAEYRAHLVWNLRSGLNVAALQCQFSPYLRAVPNYNAILAHHSVELAAAYKSLDTYFKRVNGPVRGQKAFDDYFTTTYNNFSARMQAQFGFCQTAAQVAREALAAPKGDFYPVAQRRMRELRNSLLPSSDTGPIYNPNAIRLSAVPPLQADCWTKKNKLQPRCAALVR